MRLLALLTALTAAAAPQEGKLYDQALRLYALQQFEQAEHVLRQAVQQDSRSGPVRFLLGATLLQLHRNTEAIRELEAAIAFRPQHADAAKLLASEYLGSHQPASAIRVLTPLLHAGPADEETYLLVIQACQDRGDAGDIERVLRLAEQGLARYSKSAPLMAAKGFALRESGRLSEAHKVLEQALVLDPSSSQARVLLADVLNREGKYAPAMALFRSVIQADPGDVESRLGLSRVLAAAGQVEEALAELNRTKEIAPTNALVRLELSQLYSRLGRPEKARDEAEEFRRLRNEKR